MTRAHRIESVVLAVIVTIVAVAAGWASFTHVHDWTMRHAPAAGQLEVTLGLAEHRDPARLGLPALLAMPARAVAGREPEGRMAVGAADGLVEGGGVTTLSGPPAA